MYRLRTVVKKYVDILKMCRAYVGDFIWPSIDKVENPMPPDEGSTLRMPSITNLYRERYPMLKQVYDEEFRRLHTIESKSTILLGIIGVLTTISVSYVMQADFNAPILWMSVLAMWLIVQLARCLWLAVRVLHRDVYAVVGVVEICSDAAKEDDLYRTLCDEYVAAIIHNYSPINKKAEYMTLMHLTLRNVIMTLMAFVAVKLFV